MAFERFPSDHSAVFRDHEVLVIEVFWKFWLLMKLLDGAKFYRLQDVSFHYKQGPTLHNVDNESLR
jgi:hypothetical protein